MSEHSDDLETLKRRRSALKAKLTIFKNHIKLLNSASNLSDLQRHELEGRYERFKSLYNDFDTLQTEIEVLLDTPEDEFKTRCEFEEQYYQTAALARNLLTGKIHPGNESGKTHTNVRLPKIDLPHFDGSVQGWLEFKDTYISLIHNNSCNDDIMKFHYLRSCLRGSAALVIKNIDFTSDNYANAWDLLCQRYDNDQLLIHNHVQALFNVHTCAKESSKSLRYLVDVTNKNIRALKTLKQPTEHWDTLIIFMMAQKLDSSTSRYWEEHRNTLSKPPTLDQFIKFIENQINLLEKLEENSKNNSKPKLPDNYQSNKSKSFIVASNNTQMKPISQCCPLCSEKHLLYTCETFRSLPIEARIEKAKLFKVCMNCLRSGHTDKMCKLSHCKYCKARHNTLLHTEPERKAPINPMPNNVALSANLEHSFLDHGNTSFVLLSTALVRVRGANGTKHCARVLLDNGSTANFITQALSVKLGLSRSGIDSTTVTGINNQTSYSAQSCNLTLESYCSDYTVDLDCLILPEITKVLPSRFVNVRNLPLPSGVSLADPTFNIPSVIDILIGAETFWNVLGHNSLDLGKNQPKLRETKFGWIVSGHVAYSPSPLNRSQAISSHFCDLKDEINIDRFWELDSVPTKHLLTTEENACERHFSLNTYRNNEGRFVVTIPLKKDPHFLGDSLQMAISRFLSLERRFKRDSIFRERYLDFIREYEQLGHMTKESTVHNFSKHSSNEQINYFLPHHGVIRDSSTTTKLRTVFDASAVTTSGLSLNAIQMVGPVVQDDLLSILLRFRQHRFVVSGDIEKMYRAIEINPSQRSLQRIVFRADTKEPLEVYTLNTVTYGTASAPYLATKCLTNLASSASCEEVKRAIQHDFYVDDFLSGSNTISETVELCKGVISTLSSAKFNLRKFKSNDSRILNQISGNETPSSNNILDFSDNNVNASSKTLGLNWLCDSDSLSFLINIDQSTKRVTKRNILSVISQIFDPLGLVGPCVVEAKIIMQQLWVNKYNWDDIVSEEIRDLWISFVNTLTCLNQLKIPRFVSCKNDIRNEIHVFSDASEKAYGACLYIRSINGLGVIHVQLLASRNRIAPIRPTTIPRLELCGALVGARLCTKVRDSLTMHIDSIYLWCDSTIVLGWLSSSPNQLKPFVRNRVNEIQETTVGCTWSYVPSKDNPADFVSRGLKADTISISSLWWSGPSYLLKEKNEWPQMPNVKQELPEVVCHLVSKNQIPPNEEFCFNNSITCNLISKYSNFNYLKRVVAYILRFIYNLRNPLVKHLGFLSSEELEKSLNCILHNAQLQMFPEEYMILKSNKSLPRSNRLVSLSPFIDSNDILRAGGRLDNSPYDFNVKHPILLCSKHALTKLIFQDEHLKLFHAGPQLLLAHIRQRYWPLGGRNLSKSIVKSCLKCFRYRAQNVQPTMGQLPQPRSDLQFPFLNCSVDYAGPILIADRKGRGCKLVKAYLCIFVCLAVKAVHLELVTALSKEAYIAALKRFVSRRGKPRSIWCDNGTNFVGACNEFNNFLSSSDVASDMAQEGIQFHFAPPYSPHFNGIAEAAVKSAKGHLKKLLSLTHLTYEEMVTCLTLIEAILNSRPLTPASSDPLDFTALTPAHFLIGRSLMSVPHPQVIDHNITHLERYQRVEYIRQHFWQRFSNEYVCTLQQKSKWATSTGNLALGALVLIKDKSLPPLLWSLGRITKVYPGSDGITRVAEVSTKNGTIVRGFNSLCPLPPN